MNASHHDLGMSTWPARTACPKFIPSSGDSEIARRGTRCHELFASLVRHRHGGPEVGRPGEDERDLMETAEWALDALPAHPFVPWEPEVRVEFPDDCDGFEAGGRYRDLAGIFGTCDALLWDDAGKTLTVADLKTFSRGDRRYMPQLMGYAGALLSGRSLLGDGSARPSVPPADRDSYRVRLVVLHGGSRETETLDATYRQCLDAGLLAVGRERMLNGAASPCSFCRHCARLGSCGSVGGAMERMALAAGAREGAEVTDDDVREYLRYVPAVTAFVERLRDRAVKMLLGLGDGARLESGGTTWALTRRAKPSRVRPFADVCGYLRDMGYDSGVLAGRVKLGVGDLKASLRDLGVPKGDMEDILRELVEPGDGCVYSVSEASR